MIAKDFEDFTKKVVNAESIALNSEVGQELTRKLLQTKRAQNPNLTTEEWEKAKQEFMVFIFHEFLKSNPTLIREMGNHIYDKLNK